MKCDVCGGFYKEHMCSNSGAMVTNYMIITEKDHRYIWKNAEVYDLCPNCMTAVKELIIKRKEKKDD